MIFILAVGLLTLGGFSYIKLISNPYPELEEINGKDLRFKELNKIFTNIAEAKGAEYAFEVLGRAELPPNTDTHLLGHTVGDVLYKDEGVDGITVCTKDFRNACSHSIVVGHFLKNGENALGDIFEACQKAPGGSGAYGMCYHGLGHGVLVYTNYDLEKTAVLCEKSKPVKQQGMESAECIGGAIMEIVGGGQHNPEAWAASREKYLPGLSNPLYPCTASFMPSATRYHCLLYLTPHLWEQVGGDSGNLKAEDFESAFRLCETLPATNTKEEDACYGGFGKEFVTLVKSRDIRQIDNFSKENSKQVYDWCLLAEKEEGIKACIRHAVNSLYWGGENNVDASIGFCAKIEKSEHQSECFKHLSEIIVYYSRNDQNETAKLCSKIPENFRTYCK